MEQLIANVVQWIIVPLVMVAILGWAFILPNRISDPEHSRSAWAGFWAGLLIFVIYVVSQLSVIRAPSFEFDSLPEFALIPLIGGVVAGFVFLWLARFVAKTSLVGLLTLLLAATSTIALFSYVFINPWRGLVLYLILGIALGVLLHIVFFPSSIRDV